MPKISRVEKIDQQFFSVLIVLVIVLVRCVRSVCAAVQYFRPHLFTDRTNWPICPIQPEKLLTLAHFELI